MMKSTTPVSDNAFAGQSQSPTNQELSAALGRTKVLWDELLAELAEELDAPICEWNSYSTKAGWSLRVKRGDRVLLYLAPLRGGFRASLALGDKALQAAKASGLPPAVMKMIEAARKYAEGTAVRIDVKRRSEIGVVKKLARAKLQN
jgi:hypothetical protein